MDILSGYRVLDCSIAMAGPFAAQRLGVKPYPAKKALEVARRLNEAKIRTHLGRILDGDNSF